MTQQTIERHLLKVGSSRYQDPEFKRQFPNFSPISRFGIGILSSFMISDNVEILTCHPEDPEARFMTLRSVHGKYLIRLLDKDSGDIPGLLRPHGTSISLLLRPSARLASIIDIATRWIVLPHCDVVVKIDKDPERLIGFASPKVALEHTVRGRPGVTLDGDADDAPQTRYRVDEIDADGITMAYLLRWNDYYKVWSFAGIPPLPNAPMPMIGTCVEGIRVTFPSPGLEADAPIAALLNATGPRAPRTNVARSAIEVTSERNTMLRVVYRNYCAHIKKEFQEMQENRNRSLTWATQEVRYLANSLVSAPLTMREIADDEVATVPIIVLERHGERVATSISEIKKSSELWTVNCLFLQSAEYLIREAGSDASLSGVIDALKVSEMRLPSEPVISDISFRNWALERAFENKEVDKIIVNREQRRLDVRWVDRVEGGRWFNFASHFLKGLSEKQWQSLLARFSRSPNRNEQRIDFAAVQSMFVGRKDQDIEVRGRANETMVRANQKYFVLPGTHLERYLRGCFEEALAAQSEDATLRLGCILHIVMGCVRMGRVGSIAGADRVHQFVVERFGPVLPEIDVPSLIDLLTVEEQILFDPSMWGRERLMEAFSQ